MQVLCGVLCLVSVLSLTAALPLAPYEEVQDRNSRAVGSHDYVLTLFSKRRSFIDANCNATMNGFPVSQHICRTNAIKSFMAYTPDAIDNHTCNLDFTINLLGEQAIGADIALYKIAKDKSRYEVYIARKNDNGLPPTPIAHSDLSATSQGWQVFSIDKEAKTWPMGVSNFSVKVIVVSRNGTVVPCKPLFRLNTHPEPSNSTTDGQPINPVNYTPVITTFAVAPPSPVCTSYPQFCNSVRRRRGVPASENERERRYTENHDYVQRVFAARESFKEQSCNALFNGQPVSPLHCNPQARLKFSFAIDNGEMNEEPFICDIKFDIQISSRDKTLGADLSLYKASTSNDGALYWVIVIRKVTAVYSEYVLDAFIDGTTSGWITFHIDSIARWPVGTNEFGVRLLVTRIAGADSSLLTCNNVSSVFILPPSTDGSGVPNDIQVYPDLNYVPVVTAFVQRETPIFPIPGTDPPFRLGRSAESPLKRPALQRSRFQGNPTSRCQLEDLIVDLPELFQGSIKVLPRRANIRQCVTDGRGREATREREREEKDADEPGWEDPQCLATKSSSLDVLVQMTGAEHVMESIPGIVIEECGFV